MSEKGLQPANGTRVLKKSNQDILEMTENERPGWGHARVTK